MKILDLVFINKDYSRDFITRSTYNSNAIEGSSLTYAETYAILYNDNSFKIKEKEPRGIYEAINHRDALENIFEYLAEKNKFDERFIKKINKTINKNILEVVNIFLQRLKKFQI